MLPLVLIGAYVYYFMTSSEKSKQIEAEDLAKMPWIANCGDEMAVDPFHYNQKLLAKT